MYGALASFSKTLHEDKFNLPIEPIPQQVPWQLISFLTALTEFRVAMKTRFSLSVDIRNPPVQSGSYTHSLFA